LREKLDEALVVLAIQISNYTDSPLVGAPNGTLIKKTHITELRDRARSGSGTSGSGGSSGGVQYVLPDVQGSSRAVMNNNGVGASTVVARHDYLPFGQELSSATGLRSGTQGYGASDTNRQKYGLTERDDATGLDHTWWRKYESTAGRWTSPDPLAGSLADPQSFNRYSYTQNDPVNFVDPSGLNPAAPGSYFTGTIWRTWYGNSKDGYHLVGISYIGSWSDTDGGGSIPGFNENAIREGLKKALSNPKCKTLVDSLLNAVAIKKNPLASQYSQGGIMGMFEAVMLEDRLTRNPPPGSGGHGSPIGNIARGNAAIFVEFRSWDRAGQPLADLKGVLGDLMHLGGEKKFYTDRAFANIVHRDYPGLTIQMWPGDPNYKHYQAAKNNENSIEWSYYWHQAVNTTCFK
jgi:RHS repeat-associated protein